MTEAHWHERFLDIPHSQLDCGELVEKVLREQFGRVVSFPKKERNDLFHRAGLIAAHRDEYARRTTAPTDGCGVMMLARGRMGHMGLYCAIDQGYILHSDSNFGKSVCMPINRILTLYRIEGFYEWI